YTPMAPKMPVVNGHCSERHRHGIKRRQIRVLRVGAWVGYGNVIERHMLVGHGDPEIAVLGIVEIFKLRGVPGHLERQLFVVKGLAQRVQASVISASAG